MDVEIVIDEKELERAKKKAKWRERKQRVKQKLNDGVNWCTEHKEFVIGIGLPFLFGAGKAVKGLKKGHDKKVNLNAEKDLKELYCYDRKLGHYWKLKRKLTNSEWRLVEEKVRNGERMGDVLNGMRVLD